MHPVEWWSSPNGLADMIPDHPSVSAAGSVRVGGWSEAERKEDREKS